VGYIITTSGERRDDTCSNLLVNGCKRVRWVFGTHNGEHISTGFVESTVNQVISKSFCKKQQMQWTKRGAHLLLQARVKTLNQELGMVFQRWYPDLQLEEKPLAA
jgi:hypothetical protein